MHKLSSQPKVTKRLVPYTAVMQSDFQRDLAAAEAWLSDRGQWPGGPVDLPKARLETKPARRGGVK